MQAENRVLKAGASRIRWGSHRLERGLAEKPAGRRTLFLGPSMADDQESVERAQELDRLARRGIAALTVRQVLVQALTFAGGIVLARVLTPTQFGIFGIAAFLVNAAGMVGDFGLAPSFIQRKQDLTEYDLQVGFTLQQALVTVTTLAVWLAAPILIRPFAGVPGETVWLVRAIVFSLFLASWRTMSVLQLERELQYGRLAWVEGIEAVTYQGFAVALVLLGAGVWSLVWATLARGVLGTCLVFALRPWRIRLAFDASVARRLLRFALPFQFGVFANSLFGWVTPVLVGTLIGPGAVGLITWASSNGRKPLALAENAARVSFSHFSRLQEDPELIQRTLVRYLTYLLVPSLVWATLLWTAGYPLVEWVYTAKWLPAVPALMVYAFALNLNVVDWLLLMTLNGTGLVGRAAKAQFARMLVAWLASFVLVKLFGMIGVPIAQVVATIVMIALMLPGLGRRAFSQTLLPLAWLITPAVVATGAGQATRRLTSAPAESAIVTGLVTMAAFIVTLWCVSPGWFKGAMRARIRQLRGASGAAFQR